jgi:hypothetical protein
MELIAPALNRTSAERKTEKAFTCSTSLHGIRKGIQVTLFNGLFQPDACGLFSCPAFFKLTLARRTALVCLK